MFKLSFSRSLCLFVIVVIVFSLVMLWRSFQFITLTDAGLMFCKCLMSFGKFRRREMCVCVFFSLLSKEKATKIVAFSFFWHSSNVIWWIYHSIPIHDVNKANNLPFSYAFLYVSHSALLLGWIEIPFACKHLIQFKKKNFSAFVASSTNVSLLDSPRARS